MLLASCGKGGDPKPSIEEKQLKLLVETWEVTEVTYGGTTGNRTADYKNANNTMVLTISKSADGSSSHDYTVIGLPAGKTPWPAGGTWRFEENEDLTASIIYREDPLGDLQITYSVTNDLLQLSFNYVGAGFGRTSAVEGSWVFKFAPAN